MTQWDRLCSLPAQYKQQLDELYDKDVLPMEVRHYLAGWIERQEWWGHPLGLHIMPPSDRKPLHVCRHMSRFIIRKRAAQDYNLAMVLYQNLLENLDIQYSRFVHEVAFLQQHNIRRYKQNFQVGPISGADPSNKLAFCINESAMVVAELACFLLCWSCKLCHSSVIPLSFRGTRMILLFWPATSFGI